MHAEIVKIDVEKVLAAGPLKPCGLWTKIFWGFVLIGITTFIGAMMAGYSMQLLWGAYFVNVLFFMGLAAGGVMTTVIFQIVRARWAPGIRRIGEAQVSFLPWALLLLALSWFGHKDLFYWGTYPAPGKEWWMTPGFVYGRYLILLGVLFYCMWRYVKMSIRGDVGMVLERLTKKGAEVWGKEQGPWYDFLTKNWRGLEAEVKVIQPRMSRLAPVLVLLYALIYSLFAFDMVQGMDKYWISNMFGGFIFIGNIYIAWAMIGLTAIILSRKSCTFAEIYQAPLRWDLGKLTFGFCMLWGYLFFSQFLPQWYGNLPEETQWMILRTRDWDLPWIKLAWVVFPMCFVIPFITLLSRDVKRTPEAYGVIAVIILIGVWLERYMVVMPNFSPEHIPFGIVEIGLFLGFLGAYALSVRSFLSKLPMVPVSHPLTHGNNRW